MTPELEQLKALAESATRGEWDSKESRVYLPNIAGGFDIRNSPNAEANAAYIAYANPERILALIAENERLAHSRKDAEPVAWMHEAGNACYAGVNVSIPGYTVPLFTHPPEADKLLQQAMEALEYRLQQTRPIHQADVVMEAIRTYLEGKK